jgi:hypothetical protein
LKVQYCPITTFFEAATPAREAGSASSGEVDDSSGCDGRKEAQTWLFKSCVRLKEGQTFSNLLDASKQQMNISLASATVISWACTNNALRQSHDSNVEYFEGFLHAPTLIRLGCVLPEKQTIDAGEIVEVTFEEMHPGPGKDYMYHPTIKMFLEETSLDPLASDKRIRMDYCGSRIPGARASSFQYRASGHPHAFLKAYSACNAGG